MYIAYISRQQLRALVSSDYYLNDRPDQRRVWDGDKGP